MNLKIYSDFSKDKYHIQYGDGNTCNSRTMTILKFWLNIFSACGMWIAKWENENLN